MAEPPAVLTSRKEFHGYYASLPARPTLVARYTTTPWKGLGYDFDA
jgi:hypothetical protein